MQILRVLYIISIALRYRLDRLIPSDKLPLWAKILLLPIKIFPNPKVSQAISLRLSFEALGPIFVKFGQILSTRRDLFENETSDELQKLQDQVPPFDYLLARSIVEEELEDKIENLFDEFDNTPLASASLAQVHAAKLKTGEDIVVKIIRPGIEVVIKRDLMIMHLMARILLKVWKDAKRLHPDQIVVDYEQTILDELNLQLEAANAHQLRKNWHGKVDRKDMLFVPKVHFDLSRQNVMVMERIYGLSSADLAGMQAANVNMKKLAHLGVEIFFTQVFEDNFFHADMHPGNVFIDATNPEQPSYIALDCAIIGSLTDDDKSYLARNLLAFFHQDYYEVARLHVESAWVPADTDIREFESVIRSVCEPIFQKPIKDISFGRVLLSLFQTARRFNMEVQPQLVLLQKTLLNIEGMGRQLYPDLDLWETAAPFMEKWMKERMGISGLFKKVSKNAPQWLERLPEIPDLVMNAMFELRAMGQSNKEQIELLKNLNTQVTKQRSYGRMGALALIAALVGSTFPLMGLASQNEALVGVSVLGSFGVYWMFLKL